MQITVQDPYSHSLINLTAQPERCESGQGWRIRFPHKFSFLMAQQNGNWQVIDDISLHPVLVEEIIWALHPMVRAKHVS